MCGHGCLFFKMKAIFSITQKAPVEVQVSPQANLTLTNFVTCGTRKWTVVDVCTNSLHSNRYFQTFGRLSYFVTLLTKVTCNLLNSFMSLAFKFSSFIMYCILPMTTLLSWIKPSIEWTIVLRFAQAKQTTTRNIYKNIYLFFLTDACVK